MKKVKFMLLSLALVAIVGGALAFKVKSGTKFCYTLATTDNVRHVWTCSTTDGINNPPDPLICNSFTQNSSYGGNSGAFICTAPKNGDEDNCDHLPACDPALKQLKAGD